MNSKTYKSSMLTLIDIGSMLELITGILRGKLNINTHNIFLILKYFKISVLIYSYSYPAKISPWEMGSKMHNSFYLIFPIFAFYWLGNAYVSVKLIIG